MKALLICLLCLVDLSLAKSCSQNSECNNGICQQSICICNKGFVSFGPNQACNYEQKEKLTAFLLSFLVGSTGADWFYLAQGDAGSKHTNKQLNVASFFGNSSTKISANSVRSTFDNFGIFTWKTTAEPIYWLNLFVSKVLIKNKIWQTNYHVQSFG